MTWFSNLHHFLVRNASYPLALSSVMALSFLAARILTTGNLSYVLLVWNLFLAWMPYLCSLWAAHLHERDSRAWWPLIVPLGLWLLFLPNAPYLLTDFGHLAERPPVPLWFDIGLLASFALTGLFLAVVSLNTMHRLVEEFLGRVAGWLFVAASAGLSGVGIYLGRFLGWNSWDLFSEPRRVIADVGLRLLHPFAHPRTVVFTAMFSAVLLTTYLTFISLQKRRTAPWPSPSPVPPSSRAEPSPQNTAATAPTFPRR